MQAFARAATRSGLPRPAARERTVRGAAPTRGHPGPRTPGTPPHTGPGTRRAAVKKRDRYYGCRVESPGRQAAGHQGNACGACNGPQPAVSTRAARAGSSSVAVRGRRGPGSYRALVTLTVIGPHGGIASASRVPGIPATITTSGGSFTIDTTGAGGRTLAAAVSWTCP